jgi:hypothetical protein
MKRNFAVTINDDGRLIAGDESFCIGDPIRRAQMCEVLSQGGMHVTDEARDRDAVAIEDDPVTASYLKTFEPKVPENLQENLMFLEQDEEVDFFLEAVGVFAYGTPAERKELSALLDETNYPTLASMALLAIKKAGVEAGAQLVRALSENSPDLFWEMQKAAGVA